MIAPRKYKRRFFSLAEMMAALIILSLIMLALFEMMAATQQMWSSTESRLTVHDNARVFFDIVGRDIKSMVVDSSSATNIKWDDRWDGADRYHMVLVTNSGIGLTSADTNELIEVGYYWDNSDNRNNKIVRRYSTVSDGATNWDFYNATVTSGNVKYMTTYAHSDVIVEGVRAFEIECRNDWSSGNINNSRDTLPAFVMVRIVLEDPDASGYDQRKTETEFYKIFFID